jgi:hypothetical protein
MVPKEDSSPGKPSIREPHRHAHYPGRPMYPPYPPHPSHMLHPSQMHNGYPTSEPDMYRYPPHMYPMPPGYGMRSSERGFPHPTHRPRPNEGSPTKPSTQPVAGKDTPHSDGAKTGDEQGIPLTQRTMARNEMGVPPGYGMPQREGFPPGYGQRPNMEMGIPPAHGWPMDTEHGFPPGYNPWHHQHGYPPPSPLDPVAMTPGQRERWRMEEMKHPSHPRPPPPHSHMHPAHTHQYMQGLHYPYGIPPGHRPPQTPPTGHTPLHLPPGHTPPHPPSHIPAQKRELEQDNTTEPPSKKAKTT